MIVGQGSINLAQGIIRFIHCSGWALLKNQASFMPMCQPRNWCSKTILEKFKDLFSPELGVVKDVKVHLIKNEFSTPKIFKARPILNALLDNVDQ